MYQKRYQYNPTHAIVFVLMLMSLVWLIPPTEQRGMPTEVVKQQRLFYSETCRELKRHTQTIESHLAGYINAVDDRDRAVHRLLIQQALEQRNTVAYMYQRNLQRQVVHGNPQLYDTATVCRFQSMDLAPMQLADIQT